MKSFTDRAIAIIKEIPPGKVMTYGQIATLAGQRRGARQVVRILHSMSSKYHLPWHRVINAQGQIGFQDEGQFMSQKLSLEAEGIVIDQQGKVDLEVFRYQPEAFEDEHEHEHD